MSTTLDLRNANRLFYGATEAQSLYYGGTLLWTKPAASVIYSLNEGSGTTVTSGTGEVATTTGDPVWNASPTRLTLDGTNDYITGPAPAGHGTDYVWAVLARSNNAFGDRALVSRYGTDNFTQRVGQLRVASQRLDYVAHRSTTTNGTVISAPAGSVPVGTWLILAAYVQVTQVTLTINGAVVATGSFASENREPVTASVPVRFGARYNPITSAISDYFIGDLAGAAAVYNATSTTMAEVVTQLRAVATAKGISIP